MIAIRAGTGAIRALCGAVAGTALMTALPARAGPSFYDGTFAPGDVATVIYNDAQPVSPGTGGSAGQVGAGNPAPAYQVAYSYGAQPGGADLLSTSLERTFVYDPSLSGAIRSLYVSLDQYATLTQDGRAHAVGAYTLRPLIAQDGVLYEAVFALDASDLGGTWHSLGRGGLTASDFGLFDRFDLDQPDYSQHPDFAGGEITFGFAMRTDGGGDPILRSADGVLRADNFRAVVNALPEPGTWSLMIAGFGLVGAVLRRRGALPA